MLWIFAAILTGTPVFPSMRTQIVNPYRLAHHGIGTSASTGSVNTSNHNANAYEVQGQSYLRHQQGGVIGIGKTRLIRLWRARGLLFAGRSKGLDLGDPQTLLLLSDAFVVLFSAVVFPTFALPAFSEFLGLLEAPEGFWWSHRLTSQMNDSCKTLR